ncbi:methylated-DNA-[protein]-cysteine S-methyltransferase [Metabacillus crassostreae]|uniref:methylated-DNA--[protein]-cysteine S-methyltransferase n=1 Tax=Metabacillus crassostreae TaxID=929098 RepID=UPI00195C0EFF|nr:methylated-DNA--[protein]-cysteine S-methyltransferase [Metabacillus crassostreae]MBM7606426.1 methylated-DNA-[protein]-cysteine S-methyltransferase [Metabacillus crassostreae]
MDYFIYYNSPIGRLTIVSNPKNITHLFLEVEHFDAYRTDHDVREHNEYDVLIKAKNQLHEYFHEGRKDFELAFEINGTDFQRKVWKELQNIPYGESCSYQDIATKIGQARAVRAIGQANKANKLPIFIPCHRVIGKNKKLTGYAGNKNDIKAELLTLESITFKK